MIPACGRGDLDQSSPDAVLQTAKSLVEQGRADRLTDLLYAENDSMRAVLDEMGQVLGRLGSLATLLQERFPKELDELRQAASASGATKAGSIFSQASAGIRAASGTVGPPPKATQDLMESIAKQLIADPYAFLTTESGKLSTTSIADDRVAILYDAKPIIPIIGLTMQRRDERWFIVLPTTFPSRKGAVSILPKNEEGWEILGSLFDVFDNVLIDTIKEVETGKADSLEEVTRLLGEKAFLPAAMVVFAYAKVFEQK